jgi:predicted peptidase
MFNSWYSLAAVLALPAVLAAQTAPTPQSVQTAKQFAFSHSTTATVNYLLFLPQGCEVKGEKRWPLILFLHGAGERGNEVWKVAVHGPPREVAAHADFPFIVVSPQCPEGRIWSNDVLLGLLDDIMRTYPVDPSRVYLTGLSMGGYGTWELGLAYPERFAAIAPICGGANLITSLLASGDAQKTAAARSLGVWAFHGAKDPVVPVTESQRMVEWLKGHGVTDVKLTVYPEAEHDCWTESYRNPELYDWFLKHQRK